MTDPPAIQRLLSSHGVVAFVGPFGTGKTEVAINYAQCAVSTGRPASLVDFDIITPYFRVGDHRGLLRASGLHVITAPGSLSQFETPSLSPEIDDAIREPAVHVVLDVGGDPTGARLLGTYREVIAARGYDMWLVVNPYRPESATVELLDQQRQGIEQQSGLAVTGGVANPHLGPLTDADVIIAGIIRTQAMVAGLELPLKFATVTNGFVSAAAAVGVLVLPLIICSLLPWERSQPEG